MKFYDELTKEELISRIRGLEVEKDNLALKLDSANFEQDITVDFIQKGEMKTSSIRIKGDLTLEEIQEAQLYPVIIIGYSIIGEY